MAIISNNDIASAIYSVSKNKIDNELSLSLKNVVKFLARKHLLLKAKEILFKLEKIINQENGIIVVKASSTKKLSEETKKEIRQFFKKRHNAKEVILQENLDEKLLGGTRIEVDDEVIDLSFKNRMEQLQKYLTRPL